MYYKEIIIDDEIYYAFEIDFTYYPNGSLIFPIDSYLYRVYSYDPNNMATCSKDSWIIVTKDKNFDGMVIFSNTTCRRPRARVYVIKEQLKKFFGTLVINFVASFDYSVPKSSRICKLITKDLENYLKL